MRLSSAILGFAAAFCCVALVGGYCIHAEDRRKVDVLRIQVGVAQFSTPALRSRWRMLRDAFLANPRSEAKAGDLAMFLHSSGNSDAALACYAWVRQLNRGNVRWTYPAVLKVESADPIRARTLLEDCRRQHPEDNTVLATYALVLSRLGDPSAGPAYLELIRRDFFRASAHTGYGMVLMRAGKLSAAVEQFKTAVSLDPTDRRPNIALAHILVAPQSKTESNRAKASVSGDTVFTPLEIDPYLDELYWRFPETRYLKGRAGVEAAHRRFAQGLRLLERARSSAPEDIAVIVDMVYYKTLLGGPTKGRFFWNWL